VCIHDVCVCVCLCVCVCVVCDRGACVSSIVCVHALIYGPWQGVLAEDELFESIAAVQVPVITRDGREVHTAGNPMFTAS